MPRKAKSAIQQMMDGNPNNRTSKELYKRAKNEKRLEFGNEKLVPPSWLSSGAKNVFKQIVDTYKDTSFLNDADLITLAQYADWYSEYKACNTRLKKNGRSVDGKPSGDLRLKLSISAELDRLAKELGLTPASRASLAIHLNSDSNSDTADHDEFDDEFDDGFENKLRSIK